MKKTYSIILMLTLLAVSTLRVVAGNIPVAANVPNYEKSPAMVVDFTVSDTLTCSGIVQFTDLSNNGATAWIWYFGDGNASTVQNPAHTYTAAGFYSVKLITVGISGIDSLEKVNYVHVDFLTAPTVSPDTSLCQFNSATLTASGSGQIAWFDSLTGGVQLDTGAVFNTGPLVATTTFYAAAQQAAASSFGGPPDTSIGTGTYYAFNNDRYLRFDVTQNCRLVSVKVFAQGAGPRTVYLEDGMGNPLNSYTANVPDGESRLYLNFDLQPGTNFRLGNNGSSNFFRNDAGAAYPYDINGMVSITGNNAGPGAGGFYYFFYDWEVSFPPCSSPRIPVTVTVVPGPQASFLYNQNLNIVTCANLSLGATSILWDFGDGDTSSVQNPTHTYTAPGTYIITLTVSDGNCSSSMQVTIVVTTAAGINENSLLNVSLSPNPVTDYLKVELPSLNEKVTLTLSNSVGQQVAQFYYDQPSNITNIDFSKFPKGMYLLKIETADKYYISRIAKN